MEGIPPSWQTITVREASGNRQRLISEQAETRSVVMESQHPKMTLQEKLDFIDDEIKKLHLYCTKAGYTESQIKSFAKPFFKKEDNHLGSAIWANGKVWKRRAVTLVVLAVMAILFFMYVPVFRVVFALARHGAKQILPLWDWTSIMKDFCILKNPMYEPLGLSSMDCELCEVTERVERVQNLDSQRLLHHMQQQTPLIVEDASINWGNKSNITIAQLAEMYNTDRALKDKNSCRLRTNIRGINWDHNRLLNQVLKGKTDHFYAHWESCHASAAKALRQIYTSPYFLPAAYNQASFNWVFVSSNYSGKIFKPVDASEDVLLLLQLKGQNHVQLSALKPCTDVCFVLEDILHQGEIFCTVAYALVDF